MAGVKEGFSVTMGVILAFIFVPMLFVILACGGCAAFLGVGGVAVKEAVDHAQAARERHQEQQVIQVDPAPDVAAQNQPDMPELPGLQPDAVPANQDVPAANQMPDQRAPAETPAALPLPADEDPGKAADAALKLALTVRKRNESAGDKRLEEIIQKWPDTDAAAEARNLLAK